MIADRNFDVEKMVSFLKQNDNSFTQPLTMTLAKQKVSLESYATKLCKKGTIAYEVDGKEIKGMVIGYAHDLPSDGSSYITQVVTNLQYRRQGVCSRLLDEYLGFCRVNHICSVWLTTGKDNDSARRTYEKVGFKLVENDSPKLVKYVYKIFG